MTRLGQRWSAPLLALAVAALGLVGVVAAGEFARLDRAAPAGQAVPSHDDRSEWSLVARDMPAVIQTTADHVRSSVRHGAPVTTLVGAALACLVLAPTGAVSVSAVSICRAPLAPVRRRGPPALAAA